MLTSLSSPLSVSCGLFLKYLEPEEGPSNQYGQTLKPSHTATLGLLYDLQVLGTFVGKVLWFEKTPLKTPLKTSILDTCLWNDLLLSLSICQTGLQKGTLGSCKFHSIAWSSSFQQYVLVLGGGMQAAVPNSILHCILRRGLKNDWPLDLCGLSTRFCNQSLPAWIQVDLGYRSLDRL